jgi:hypothetical protein
MLGNSWVATQLAASQGGLSSMELIILFLFCAAVPCKKLTILFKQANVFCSGRSEQQLFIV